MSDVKTYVAGHKSPDTDSICSAISFANFLTQMGTPATPVCAGEANKETTYVLNHFGFEHLKSLRIGKNSLQKAATCT